MTHEYTVKRRLLRRFSTRWGWSSSAGLLEKIALKKNLLPVAVGERGGREGVPGKYAPDIPQEIRPKKRTPPLKTL